MLLRHAAFIVAIGLLGVIAALAPPMAALEQRIGLGWLFGWRGPIPARSDVIIIALDQQSADHLNLPSKPSQWPRQLHAQLVRQLTEAGAAVIVFDLPFDTPSPIPQQDMAFAVALRAAGNTVLTESLEQQQITLPMATGDPVNTASIEQTTLPIALLARAAIGTAAFALPKNSRIDAAWFFSSSADSIPMLPTLALQVQALDTFPSLRKFLQHDDPAFAATLPIDRSDISQPGMAEKMTRQLRSYFFARPLHSDRIVQAIRTDNTMTQQQKAQLHGLIDVYRGPVARYLNFYGPPRSIDTVPYFQAVQQSGAMAVTFKGKAVFIGYSSSLPAGQDRIRDDYDTVFSRVDGVRLSGVEIGATAFSNALDQNFVRPLGGLTRAALLFAVGGLLAALCRTLRATQSIAALMLIAAAYATVALQLFAQHQLWLPLITPLLLMPLALLSATLLRSLAAKKETLRLQHTFGHFVPPHMVERLAHDANLLGAVAPFANGVCMATDAANYTRLAESIDPVALTELMNRYYATLFAPVATHHGIVSDIKGDAMLAIWTGDADNKLLRRQACNAACDLHSAILQAATVTGAAMLPTRIGLAYGPITVGNVGAAQHYEYRAVGDTVNTASRIEGLNKHLGTWLLASADVVDGLDEFVVRPLGLFLVPGKSKPIDVVEILGRAADCDAVLQYFRKHLCRDFCIALTLFQQRDFDLAHAAFAAILRDTPNDGPSQFYSRECVRKRTGSASEDCHPVICITEK